MLARGVPCAYVDPFDRICRGLSARPDAATTDLKEAHSSLTE